MMPEINDLIIIIIAYPYTVSKYVKFVLNTMIEKFTAVLIIGNMVKVCFSVPPHFH